MPHGTGEGGSPRETGKVGDAQGSGEESKPRKRTKEDEGVEEGVGVS